MNHLVIFSATALEVSGVKSFLVSNAKITDQASFIFKDCNISFCITGVGLQATTYAVTKKLSKHKPEVALQLGIAGVYQREIALGSLIKVQSEIFADLGASGASGDFLTLPELSLLDENEPPFIKNQLHLYAENLPKSFQANLSQLPTALGLSVNCISGNPNLGKYETVSKNYDCTVESMEGAAFHYVCLKENIPFLQIRSISNYVEPRNKDNWELKAAVDNLNQFAISLIADL